MSQIIKTIKKSVNSKSLFKEIDDFIAEAIRTCDVRWKSSIHVNSFNDLIEGFLQELYFDGKITQLVVMCDDRNNPPSQTRMDIYHFKVTYKQRNCLNTTQIEYVINSSDTVVDVLSDLVYP